MKASGSTPFCPLRSRLKFRRDESHWCLLDLPGLHIHKGMGKMDMAWCPICSNLILPLSPLPSVSSDSSTSLSGLHAQAFSAGGEGDRQQGSYRQTFAIDCMSELNAIRQQHNGCHMSNDAIHIWSFSIRYIRNCIFSIYNYRCFGCMKYYINLLM